MVRVCRRARLRLKTKLLYLLWLLLSLESLLVLGRRGLSMRQRHRQRPEFELANRRSSIHTCNRSADDEKVADVLPASRRRR